MQFSISTSKGTIALILINIVVYMFFGLNFNVHNENSFINCLIENHPRCVVVNSDQRSYQQCIKDNPIAGACRYNVSKQCLQDEDVVISCYPKKMLIGMSLSFIPAAFSEGENMLSLFTSIFMHAGKQHLIGNMIFLFLSGVYVERRLGLSRFIFFYLLAGICATLAFYLVNPNETSLLLGASGAISGLLGANLILEFYRPANPNRMGVPLFRPIVLVIFILYQFMLLGVAHMSDVAYVAHVGGFIAGLILVFFFKRKDDVYTPTPNF